MLTPTQIEDLKKYITGIVFHWTAGTYTTLSDHYHFCVVFDGKKAKVVQTKSVRERGSHTWRRNTGKVGISMCGMYDNPETKGLDYPLKKEQIEACAKLAAELCFILDIDPEGTHELRDLKNPLVTFKAPNVTDHMFYGKKDNYFKPDIGDYLTLVHDKTIWYYGKLKEGKTKREHTLKIN